VRVRWLRAALKDLDERAAYIAVDNPAAARRLVATLLRAINHLAEHPALGRPGRIAGTRELVIPPYIIPYRVRRNAVEVLRIFHGAQRWPDKL
jgi:addiction module RelE/StbE family toxin